MWWVIGGVVLSVSGGAWLFAPTIRALLGPEFEPTPRDVASVEAAARLRVRDSGGGA